MVLNLVRGTGRQGLAGIPPVRGRIVRHLLETSREEIETYLEINRLYLVEDETNRDTALRRNLLRREVMPRLAELHDGAAANICRTAELLRQEDAIALRQRPATGLLAGLWEFPNVPGALTERQAAEQLAKWGLVPHQWGKSFTDKHVFTHITWEMTVFTITVQGAGPPEWAWCPDEEREKYPMPTAFGKLEKE